MPGWALLSEVACGVAIASWVAEGAGDRLHWKTQLCPVLCVMPSL